MFFLGQINGVTTTALLRAEIIGLLTGQITDPSQLRSLWVLGTTKLSVTEPAGWEMHDDNAGATTNSVTPQVIKAPWSDDPTKYKYLRFSADTGADILSLVGFENWNAVSHVGTNSQGTLAPGSWHNINHRTTAMPWILVSASKNHVLVTCIRGQNSFQVFGGALDYFFLSEFTRDDPWNVVENGFPAWFSMGSNSLTNAQLSSNGALSRWLNTSGAVPSEQTNLAFSDAASAQSMRIRVLPQIHNTSASANVHGVGFETINYVGVVDASHSAAPDKSARPVMMPFKLSHWLQYGSIGAHAFGNITAKSPFIYQFRNAWMTGDEFDIDGERYFYLKINTGAILVKEA